MIAGGGQLTGNGLNRVELAAKRPEPASPATASTARSVVSKVK
jgi:hypothetical protein